MLPAFLDEWCGFLKRLRRRTRDRYNCVHDATTVFHETAKIVNIRGLRECIALGANSHIRGELLTFAHGGRIAVGDYCYVGDGAKIWSATNIKIGNRVLISHYVTIVDNLTHPLNPQARHEQFKAIISTGHPDRIDLGEAPVTLEDDVWVGASAIILKGVTVGEGAVVGAGSVVTSNVKPYTVVAGNPAKFVKEIPRGE